MIRLFKKILRSAEKAAGEKSLQFEAVEPRVLFSATPLDPIETTDESHHALPLVQEEAPASAPVRSETPDIEIPQAVSGDSALLLEGLNASTDTTGHAELGGNWDLEAEIGLIESSFDYRPIVADDDDLLDARFEAPHFGHDEPVFTAGLFLESGNRGPVLVGTEMLDSTALFELEEALRQLQASLRQMSESADSEGFLREVFGAADTSSEDFDFRLAMLLEDLRGDGLGLTLEIRSGDDLGGAMAAYAVVGHTVTERIYLNADWLNSGAGAAWIHQILLEEAGHAIDTRLNRDLESQGDEGELFAARMLGWVVDESRHEAIRSENDHAILLIDGVEVGVQFASYTFGNAYAVYTEPVNGTTFEAGKEQNRHHFVSEALSITRITDDIAGRLFSGNDVVVEMTIGTQTYHGWISRPIKVGGIVRGFYFWSDYSFSSLPDATTDGNTDGDRIVTDNYSFVLVVDQPYFDSLASEGTTGDGKTIKYIGSSSDRVDTALNALIGPNIAPTPANDALTVLEDSSGNSGNVLTNDTDANLDALSVTGFSVNGVAGTLGTPYTMAGVGSITLNGDGSYSFTPLGNYTGPVPAVTYTVSDGDMSANGTLSFTITPVNDAPAGTDKTITAKQNLPYTFKAADFGFTDPLDSPAHTFRSVIIATLPAQGTFTYDGSPVTEGLEISAADITKLQFTADLDENGTSYASFTFQVRDNGGTVNGGINLDPTANTITINVTEVNRAPVASADTATALEAGGVSNGTPGADATGNVLGNDTDPDAGDTKTVTAASGAGSASASGGNFTVTGLYGRACPTSGTKDVA